MKPLFGIVLIIYSIMCFSGAIYLSHLSPVKLLDFRLHQPVKHYEPPPIFSAIDTVQIKKELFFDYFSPIINAENKRLGNYRDILLRLKNSVSVNGKFDKDADEIMAIFSHYYGIAPSESKIKQLDELLLRVNTIPRALALAQAANESAWGTSRFATEGNNYFGQWCYKKGCGIVPKMRSNSAKHEVEVFVSPADSVRAYFHNINTHRAYTSLRQIRADALKQNKTPSAIRLAEGLSQYSERGNGYIEEIQNIIRANRLE